MDPVLPAGAQVMDAEAYRALFERIVASGEAYGPPGGGYPAEYTKLNLARTRRLERTFQPSTVAREVLAQAPTMTWLVITEPWCGDSAQNLPVVLALAPYAPSIAVRIALRDDGSKLIERYLTNGTQSIPKLVAFDGQGRELFTWGPRPQSAMGLFSANKAKPENERLDKDQLAEQLHRWYHENGGQATEHELLELVRRVST